MPHAIVTSHPIIGSRIICQRILCEMFQLLLGVDTETERFSPEKIVGAIDFTVIAKNCFEVMEWNVCLISLEDIVSISQVDTSK